MTAYHYKLIFIILFSYLVYGCSGAIEDQASIEAANNSVNNGDSSGSDGGTTVDNPGNSDSNGDSGTTPGSGNSGGSGGGSGGGAGGSVTAPEVTILNITGSYLRGGVQQDIIFRVSSRVGAISHVEYVVTCPSVGSIPQNSILTGNAPNTNSAVTIQRNVVSIGLGEDTIVSWNTPNLSEIKCIKVDQSLETASNNFRIRITSVGENNLITTVESQSFAIDSEAPILTANGLGVIEIEGRSVYGGNMNLSIDNISDLVTPVSEICIKINDSYQPTASDLCWKNLLSLGITPALNLSNISMKTFLSFLDFSGEIFFWAKDAAGNITTLTNNSNGTLRTDRIQLTSPSTTKIASNDITFMSSSLGLVHSTDPSSILSFDNSGGSKNIRVYQESNPAYLNNLADSNSLNIDSGLIFIKDRQKGVVFLDTDSLDITAGPLSLQTLIPNTGVQNIGPVASASFKQVKKHFIDSKGVHWFIDDGKLLFIDAQQNLSIAAGGGTDEISDDLSNPLDLKINQSDNIDLYGAFTVLPNQWVVFSADDPTLPLNPAAGPRFKLRVYKHHSNPAQRSISTIYLSGNTVQGSVDELRPYGNLAINFDFQRNHVKYITGRFCSVTDDPMSAIDKCDSAKLIQFSVSVNNSPIYMGSIDRTTSMNFKYINDDLYMMDSTKGHIYKWNSSSFQRLAGGTALGSAYCTNMCVSTSCNLKTIDILPLPTGLDQILILDNQYLRILEQGQIFTVYSGSP